MVRSQAERLLTGLGHRVTVASDGPSALIALRDAQDIDLLMTDVVMPGGMTGRELASHARAERRGLPVLLTSGYSEDPKPMDGGPVFLAKPYRRAQLAAAVAAALSGGEASTPEANRNVIHLAGVHRALPTMRQGL